MTCAFHSDSSPSRNKVPRGGWAQSSCLRTSPERTRAVDKASLSLCEFSTGSHLTVVASAFGLNAPAPGFSLCSLGLPSSCL